MQHYYFAKTFEAPLLFPKGSSTRFSEPFKEKLVILSVQYLWSFVSLIHFLSNSSFIW